MAAENSAPPLWDADSAVKAVKGSRERLKEAFAHPELVKKLYEESVIDEHTLELYKNAGSAGLHVYNAVIAKVEKDAECFDTICEILGAQGSQQLKDTMQGDYKSDLVKKRTSAVDTRELTQQLKTLQSIPDVDGARSQLTHSALHSFLSSALQAKVRKEDIRLKLHDLHAKDCVLSSDDYRWSIDELQKVANHFPDASPDSVIMQNIDQGPLFENESQQFKETLGNALECSELACNTNTDRTPTCITYLSTFSDHSLSEVAIVPPESLSYCPKYLIALQKVDARCIYYMAFSDNSCVQKWLKYKSFEQGLMEQASQIPLQFVVEKLWEGHCVVVTGFSFGGLLACIITAKIWHQHHVPIETLQRNLVCIAFAPPHIRCEVLEEAANDRDFRKIVYTIFHEDDHVPRLMRFLDSCVEEYCLQATLSVVLSPNGRATGTDFGRPLSKHLMNQLITLQSPPIPDVNDTTCSDLSAEMTTSEITHDPQNVTDEISGGTTTNTALRKLQKSLNLMRDDLVGRSRNRSIAFGTCTCYLVTSKNTGFGSVISGPAWELLGEDAKTLDYLDMSEINHLNHRLFEKHSPAYYGKEIRSAYFTESPDCDVNGDTIIEEAQVVVPTLSSIDVHHFCYNTTSSDRLGGKNRAAISIDGKNLWFCKAINFESNTLRIDSDRISEGSVQFETESIIRPNFRQGVRRIEMKTDVTLYTHFGEVVRTSVPVIHEEFIVTSRQRLVAKHNPEDLIELAFLSALLEKAPHSHGAVFSRRFEGINKFLSEIINIVPIESVLSAIACTDQKEPRGVWCEEITLCLSQLKVPLSQQLFTNTAMAIARLQGVNCHQQGSDQAPEDVYYVLYQRALKLGLKSYWLGYFNPSQQEDSVVHSLKEMIQASIKSATESAVAISGVNIASLYEIASGDSPMKDGQSSIKAPIEVLRNARARLVAIQTQALKDTEVVQANSTGSSATTKPPLRNEEMLHCVNQIMKEVKVCLCTLFAFMKEIVRVPISEKNPATLFKLFTLGASILMFRRPQDGDKAVHLKYARVSGLVQSIAESGSTNKPNELDEKYTAKLQFIAQAARRSFTWSRHYRSYWLERQLSQGFSESHNLTAATPLNTFLEQWNDSFKGKELAKVAQSHRSLIARWMKCALMVHEIREGLARYTAVGVAGLVNCGKSSLVKELFSIQVETGTLKNKRTTIPLMYNLGDKVEGLDVIDFPGGDDGDENIQGLVKFLLSLAQLVVFVVDYRRICSAAVKEWLKCLREESVPVLVCLTYGDRLFAEYMKDGNLPDPPVVNRAVSDRLEELKEDIDSMVGKSPLRTVDFYWACLESDSILRGDEGKIALENAGVHSVRSIGKWICTSLSTHLEQNDIAMRLDKYLYGTT